MAERERVSSAPRDARGVPISTELLDKSVRRLGILAIALAVGSIAALTIPYLVDLPSWSDARVRYGVHVPFIAISGSLAFLALTRRIPSARVLDVALGYQLFASLALALVVNARTWPSGASLPGWSHVAVLTIIAPIVVPTTLGRAFLAASIGAATEPLAVVFYWRVDFIELPSAAAMIFRFAPNLLAVPAALLVSRYVFGLGQRLAGAYDLGSYRLIERIDVGGMGEVWRASHRMLAKPAAVKLIRPELLAKANETARARFEREARVIATLRSVHTIQLYDYGVARDGTLYYVMELLHGLDLERLVKSHGPLTPRRVVRIARQVCRSLREAHQAGLVHRDIKPANVFVLNENDHVKVLDFGLVRDDAGEGDTSLTADGTIVGTPAYMPPEVAIGGAPVDARADLYALGCVMYFLLTAERVFAGATAIEHAVAHATRAPVPPRLRTGRAIPPDLEAIVLRCLEKDPASRPQSAMELDGLLAAIESKAAKEDRERESRV